MPLTILFLLLNILNNLEQLLGIWGGGGENSFCASWRIVTKFRLCHGPVRFLLNPIGRAEVRRVHCSKI